MQACTDMEQGEVKGLYVRREMWAEAALCWQHGLGSSACFVKSGVPWGITVGGRVGLWFPSPPRSVPSASWQKHLYSKPLHMLLALLPCPCQPQAGNGVRPQHPAVDRESHFHSLSQRPHLGTRTTVPSNPQMLAPRTGNRLTSAYHRGTGSDSALSWYNLGHPLD